MKKKKVTTIVATSLIQKTYYIKQHPFLLPIREYWIYLLMVNLRLWEILLVSENHITLFLTVKLKQFIILPKSFFIFFTK
ncbi:MAG: hypothetical protein AAF573_07685, partial [Bacteroidota bacterium]